MHTHAMRMHHHVNNCLQKKPDREQLCHVNLRFSDSCLLARQQHTLYTLCRADIADLSCTHYKSAYACRLHEFW